MKYEVRGTNNLWKDGRTIKTFKTLADAQAFVQKEQTKKPSPKKWENLEIWDIL